MMEALKIYSSQRLKETSPGGLAIIDDLVGPGDW